MPSIISLKLFLSRLILAAAAGAVVAFLASLFLTKEWQVSGRIVVFPSGKPASASQNLAEEVGNTAWIVNGDAFQKRYFGDFAADFSGAETVKNSSMVLVKFRSEENDIKAVEDLIVKIPEYAEEYARDLYEGSPFKYKLASDPEISARPVRPDTVRISTWGLAIGAVLYFLFWLMFEDRLSGRSEPKDEKESAEENAPAAEEYESQESEPQEKSILDFRPDMKKSEPKSEIQEPENIVRAFQPKSTRKIITPSGAQNGAAPENLPVAESNEPSDEEVKDRLNRLMRGEL
jgi:hypothetical protein